MDSAGERMLLAVFRFAPQALRHPELHPFKPTNIRRVNGEKLQSRYSFLLTQKNLNLAKN